MSPYGRYKRAGWGPEINGTFGWVLMELPAVLIVAFCFNQGKTLSNVSYILFAAWQIHYLHRSLIYPVFLRGKREIPLGIIGMAVTFNIINSYLQGRWLFTLAPDFYAGGWLYDPRFVVGMSIFFTGMGLNIHSDFLLAKLRSNNGEYGVPYGGIFTWVSCPHYLGEIVEWMGWAIATWSPAAIAYSLWVWANLAPRARSHHLWYKMKFRDYPHERKALIPFLF